MTEKLCVFCKHCQFDASYDEPAEFICGKDHALRERKLWDRNDRGPYTVGNINDIRELMITAETCPDYQRPAS